MRMKVAVPILTMLVVGAAPVMAQSTFFDVCGTASMTSTFKVCASAEVFLNAAGTELNVRVWNRNQTTTPVTDVTAEYTSTWGGWHTITAIGIDNLVYSPTVGVFTSQARHYHANGGSIDANGNRYDVLTQWGTDADANSLQIYNTGADVTNGHKGGIVGCIDPGPASAQHVSTCNTHPGTPYVQFVISGFQSINLNGAIFAFHSNQVALANCNPANIQSDNRCTDDSAKGNGPGNPPPPPPPPPPVPEPFTIFLLGTGLAGVGAARRRGRKNSDI